MINIRKSLHHRVIAESVETREQVHFLQKQDCGEGQGYFFCHPVIAEKLAQFLASGLREFAVHEARIEVSQNHQACFFTARLRLLRWNTRFPGQMHSAR